MAGMSYIIPDTGAEIDFDLVISESITYASTITEYPVEHGVNPADHVKPEAVSISLEVFVTNTPSEPTGQYPGSVQLLPLELPPLPAPQSPFAIAGDAISDAFNGAPPPLMVQALVFDQIFDKVADTEKALVTLQRSGGTCVVVTSTGNHSDMVLTSLKPEKTEAGGKTFSLEFHAIQVVTSQTVTAPKPVEPRGKPQASKGSQGTKPVEDQKSAAKKLLDAATKALGK